MKVCITYGHDALKETRSHCVLQKRDGSSFLQFDEVSVDHGDGNVVTEHVLCTTNKPDGSAMETKEEQGIGAPETTSNGTVISDGLRRRRRLMSLLTEHEHAFHAIVRAKVPGFGHVLIEDMKNFGRNLAADPNDEGFKAAT